MGWAHEAATGREGRGAPQGGPDDEQRGFVTDQAGEREHQGHRPEREATGARVVGERVHQLVVVEHRVRQHRGDPCCTTIDVKVRRL
jgi:hypothetical protein